MTILYAVFAYIILCFGTLCHEWAHSLFAVIFGVKSNVFDIHYSYMPLFIGINENVDYNLVAMLPHWQGILIAFAGLLVNFLFASGALILIIGFPHSKLLKYRWSFFFFYTLAFWNTIEWFNYMVIRNIFPSGDIAHMLRFDFSHTILLVTGILTSIGFLYLIFSSARLRFNEKFELSSHGQNVLLYNLIIIFVIGQSLTTLFLF